MHLPIWLRWSLYLHAIIENGRCYHIFSCKMTLKNQSSYMHALKVKSSRLIQAFWEGQECCFQFFKFFFKGYYFVSFDTVLSERPLSSQLVLIILFLGVQNLLLLRNSQFFSPEITMEVWRKKKRSQGLKYTSHNNACIYIAHFILKEKQGCIFVLHRIFCCFSDSTKLNPLNLSVLEHRK